MNVLYLTHLYLPTVGGVQRSVHNLARLMTARGHGVSVAAHADRFTRRPATRDGPEVCRLRIPSPFSYSPAERAIAAWRDRVNIARLTRLCLRRDVQIVHCHLINVDTRYALVLAQRLDLPFVVTLRGGETEHWIATHRDRCGYVSRILADAGHITGVAEALLHQAAELVPTVAGKATVVRNPLDPHALVHEVPNGMSTQDEVPYAVFVGRLEEMKDVPTLIAGFHELARRDPGSELALKIVGTGSLRPDLEREAALGPASGRIRFEGALAHEETLARIRDAAVLILPSTMSEGCPNVVLEAVALGTPVVVSDLPALTEIVQHGSTGWIFRRGDPVGLATALLDAAEPSPRRDRIVAAARVRLGAEHDPEKVATAYEQIYADVLSSSRMRSS